MASFNRVILMGNLTRDPEVRQAQNGTYIVKAGLAVNERLPDGQGGWKEEPSFFDIVIFGKRGEAFSRFMSKGRPVLIEGKLRQGRWQDKETGQNRSKIEIIVDNWEFAGGGRGEEGQGPNSGGQQQRQAPAGTQRQSAPDFPGPGDFGGGQAAAGGFPDDVPF
jgi:single-strand DNA-binding protein